MALTVGLVLARPRIGSLGSLHPAISAAVGAMALFALGHLHVHDVIGAARDLWRPLVAIASVMMTTSAAHRMGIFDRLARNIEIRTRGPVSHGFTTVFVIAALTATAFNNDAAILLLSPIVVPLIRRLYPKRPYLAEPFAFAVFVAAGVAPLSTSNPMNLVVAERAGIAFNSYAVRMAPVAVAAAITSYFMLRLAFRRELDDAIPARGPEQGSLAPMGGEPRAALAVVVIVLLSYPIISYFEGPVWVAGATGALLTVGLALRHGSIELDEVPGGVAWDVLAFMFCIFVVATGLRNAGLVDALVTIYRKAGAQSGSQVAVIGTSSALGSALLNNHPMAALNALAVERLPGDPTWRVLAALVGGDLGPRLLPMGSLAGLLWIDMVRRMGVTIRLATFVRVGVLTAIPALAVALLVLWLETLL